MKHTDTSHIEGKGIRVDDLTFSYPSGDFAIRIPSLDVKPQEKVAFIGPSGSGKTTLLKLLSGILKPNRGQVTVGGFSVSAASEAGCSAFRLKNMGMVFQEFELLEALTVRENILLPFILEPTLGEPGEFEGELGRLSQRAGIGSYLDRKPKRLSQGERQRVAICRALILSPPIFLADEPTGNLDPSTRESVLDLMEEEIQRLSATLVAVTHDHDILERFDRVVDFATFLETTK